MSSHSASHVRRVESLALVAAEGAAKFVLDKLVTRGDQLRLHKTEILLSPHEMQELLEEAVFESIRRVLLAEAEGTL